MFVTAVTVPQEDKQTHRSRRFACVSGRGRPGGFEGSTASADNFSCLVPATPQLAANYTAINFYYKQAQGLRSIAVDVTVGAHGARERARAVSFSRPATGEAKAALSRELARARVPQACGSTSALVFASGAWTAWRASKPQSRLVRSSARSLRVWRLASSGLCSRLLGVSAGRSCACRYRRRRECHALATM